MLKFSYLFFIVVFGLFLRVANANDSKISNSKDTNMPAKIYTTVKLKIAPGKEALFAELTEALVKNSLEEAGVLEFSVFRSESERDVYFFYEIFKSVESFHSHRAEAHTKNWIGRTSEFLAEKPLVTNLSQVEL